MNSLRTNQTRDSRQWLLRGVLAVMLLSAGAETPVLAQYAVDQRVNPAGQPTGRLFDVNPGLRGGAFNYTRPVSPLMSGNLSASGLLGQGFSLHIPSAIPSATSFRAPLGSAALSDFRRDSVSVTDAPMWSGPGLFARPYYDPSTTVVSPGFLQGLTVSSTSRGLSSGPLDLRIPMRQSEKALYTELAGAAAGGELSAPGTTSSIFGTPTPRLAIPLVTSPELPWRRTQQGLPETEPGRPREGEEIGGMFGPTERLATPAERLLGGARSEQGGLLAPTFEPPPWTAGWRDGEYRPGLIIATPGAEQETRVATPEPLAPTDPSMLPGYDVFTDMRLALALRTEPGAAWFKEMQDAARSVPELAPKPEEDAAKNADAFMDSMLNTPLRTLSGHGASALNDQLLKAESLMAIGHYYEAADRYDMAHALDPMNPLPLIGKGHALLAAGEYRSAASALIGGLTSFPEVARFTFDLKSLMGSGEQIDIRRADIRRRLAQQENAELRFLLGYLEYHTGDRERGMANLEQAAQQDRTGSVIARYPAMLRGEGPMPLPQLSDAPAPMKPLRGESIPESPAEPAPQTPAPPPPPATDPLEEELIIPPPVPLDPPSGG